MKIYPVELNNDLRQQIKESIDALTVNPETQDPRVLLSIEAINKLNIYDRNLMCAYMFICDYKPLEVARLFRTTRQAVQARISEINKQIQTYVNSHLKPDLSDTDYSLCD